MFYDFAITVPANTAERSPVKQALKLTHGVIHGVEVQFPIGTRCRVHCKLLANGHQVWPTNPEGNLASDGFVVAWDDFYELKRAPYQLRAVCWSTADTYAYDIAFRFAILPKETISPLAGVVGALKKFLKLVGVGE